MSGDDASEEFFVFEFDTGHVEQVADAFIHTDSGYQRLIVKTVSTIKHRERDESQIRLRVHPTI